MGKLVSNFFISLDGVVEAPNEWHFPYFDDAMGAIVGAGMATQSDFLLGRRLYDEWSAYWPANPGGDFGSHINAMPKHVVSDSLTEATWNNTSLITGPDKAAQVRAAKQAATGDIAMSGSATTVRWLLAEGLLDELALLVHPVAVGHGGRLFENTPTHALTLLHSETLPSGVLHLRYAPVRTTSG
jgi:dihydrofolate reductase